MAWQITKGKNNIVISILQNWNQTQPPFGPDLDYIIRTRPDVNATYYSDIQNQSGNIIYNQVMINGNPEPDIGQGESDNYPNRLNDNHGLYHVSIAISKENQKGIMGV